MVALNEGQHYSPNMIEINQRVEEKFEKREISVCLERKWREQEAEISVCLEKKWREREVEMRKEFRDYLSDLQADLRGPKGSGLHTPDMTLQPKPASKCLTLPSDHEMKQANVSACVQAVYHT